MVAVTERPVHPSGDFHRGVENAPGGAPMIAVIVFALAATLAAGPTDDGHDGDDSIFLIQVRQEIPQSQMFSDESLRGMGHAVCDALQEASKPAVVGAMESDFNSSQSDDPLSPEQVAFFVDAATATYCPEYSTRRLPFFTLLLH
jgi:Protein of unknown function (DUF732)